MAEKMWIPCNVCGADAFQELSKVDGWHIGRCSNCSHIYVNPVPIFKTNTAEFSEVSLDFQYVRFMYEITPEILSFEKDQLRRQFEEVTRLAGRRFDPVKFLDVGCGAGTGVHAAAEAGWDAIGVDINQELIELGKSKLGVNLLCRDLLESNLEAGQFHFIRLRDVIEHLPNPYEVLVEVERLLAPGGIGLIVTPNEARLPNQIRMALGMKRELVAAVRPPHHLHAFTPKTLKRLVERTGCQAVEVKTTMPVNPLYVTANNMRSTTNKPFVLVWYAAQAVGKGSVLVAWIKKG